MIVDGAARPGGRRLAQARERTAFTLLARPAYVSVLSGNIEPWVSDLILRTVQTGAGAPAIWRPRFAVGLPGAFAWENSGLTMQGL